MKILKKLSLLLVLLSLSSCSLFRTDKQNYDAILKRNPDWIKEQIKHDTLTIVFNKIDTVSSTKLAVDTTAIDSLRNLLLTYSNNTVFINKVNTITKYAKYPLCIKDTIRYVTDSVSLKIWQNNKGITYSLVVAQKPIKVVTKTVTITNKPTVDKPFWFIVIVLSLLWLLLIILYLRK